jgi:hypothetical protein
MRLARVLVFISLLFVATVRGFAQSTPQIGSACDARKDPAAFDKKVVKLSGVISLSFEDFSFTSKDCGDAPTAIWLIFGGDVATPTDSTVNDTSRKPGVDLEIGGTRYPIVKDANFRRFMALLTAATRDGKPVYQLTATLTGTFLAGEKSKRGDDGRTYFRGYGHLGCCSMLIISKVEDVTSVPAANLNLSGTAATSDGKPAIGVRVIDETGGCCQPQVQEATTDANGRFAFDDAGQVLHVHRDDLRPLTVVAKQGDRAVHVVLESSKATDWIVPDCTTANDKEKRVGFIAKVLMSKKVQLEGPNDDPNSFMLTPAKHPLVSALIFDHDRLEASEPVSGGSFVTAVSFQQRWIKDASGQVLGIDTVGFWKKGEWWRRSTFLNQDVIRSSGNSRADDELFDRIVDTVCIQK